MTEEETGMSAAEFKTAHESLGVSTAFIAKRCGVVVGRIWAYERTDRKTPVPERAAQVMLGLLNTFDDAADELEEIVRVTAEGFVPRHVEISEWETMLPMVAGWGGTSQGLIIAEVQRRLRVGVEYVGGDS